VVEDTQNTIRFLDTKAAFCVTLLTAMMVATLQFSGPHRHYYPHAHLVLVGVFAGFALVCLSVCVRVIFPTVHLQGRFSAVGAAGPTFFLLPTQRGHRLRALGNPPLRDLETAHTSYAASVLAASDLDLVRSMCDEVVTISFLRQMKSDRLHLAIQVLYFTIMAFFLQLAI
jgi:hypothetical protein